MSAIISVARREDELARLQALLADAVAEAGKLGASQAEAAISTSSVTVVAERMSNAWAPTTADSSPLESRPSWTSTS